MLKVICLAFLFSATVYAGQISNLIHQMSSDFPCWEVTRAEMKPLIDKAEECNVSRSAVGSPDEFHKPYYGVAQTIVFDLAANEYNKGAACLKGIFGLLENKETKNNIYQYWLNATSSSMAESIYREGRAARLQKAQVEKNRLLNPKFIDAQKAKRAIELSEDPNTNYEAEANSELNLTKSIRAQIPFAEHPKVAKFLESASSQLFGYTPEKFPTDKAKIRSDVERHLKENSKELFAQLLSDYDRDFKVDPKNEDDRKQLLDHGYVAKALSQIIDPSHPLYKKLNNCASGDYGAIQEKIALTRDSVFFLGSGFIGILGKRAGVAAASTLIRSSLSGVKKFALSGILGFSLEAVPADFVKSCSAKTDFAQPTTPLNCENKGELESFVLKWLEGRSCLANLFYLITI